MIGKQVLEHVLRSKLVIADLSFHNPNVFYELCLRHATRLPTVQLIRANERIPFDIDQYRTIKIDTGDVYAFFLNYRLIPGKFLIKFDERLKTATRLITRYLSTIHP
jgi:hypothetical protein